MQRKLPFWDIHAHRALRSKSFVVLSVVMSDEARETNRNAVSHRVLEIIVTYFVRDVRSLVRVHTGGVPRPMSVRDYSDPPH